MTAQDPAPPGELRIGHRERDAAVGRLQDAAAEGRLTLEELDARLEVAIQAKTYADLAPLLADLGSLPADISAVLPAAELMISAGTAQSRPRAPGYSREDPLRLDGPEKRVGGWTVPPFIRINHGSRWAKLNFLEARPAAPVIDIEIVGGAGWVLLILPEGWAADTDRLSSGWGTKTVQVPREPSPGRPLLIVHGSVGAGRVKLRQAKRRETRRLL